jgi:hypothetical protein
MFYELSILHKKLSKNGNEVDVKLNRFPFFLATMKCTLWKFQNKTFPRF